MHAHLPLSPHTPITHFLLQEQEAYNLAQSFMVVISIFLDIFLVRCVPVFKLRDDEGSSSISLSLALLAGPEVFWKCFPNGCEFLTKKTSAVV